MGDRINRGDLVTFSGLHVTRRKWWQLWKPRIINDPNGTYRVIDSKP